MEEKNDLPVLKYLVLEVGDKLSVNTEKFFEKKRKTGERFSYEIVSPLLRHGDVTHWFKFGGFDSVLIEPNVYRASAANRIAHDISHSFRREGDLDTLFKNLYIMHSKEELINSMYSIGPSLRMSQGARLTTHFLPGGIRKEQDLMAERTLSQASRTAASGKPTMLI
jgi:hypothetical protein